MTDAPPSPMTLWVRARDAEPDDTDARVAYYLDLMREYGHIVDRDGPESRTPPR